jgi:ABC-type transport system involved in cytochrome c biogenesis permease subunit
MIIEMTQKIYFFLYAAALGLAVSGFLLGQRWKLIYSTAALSAAWAANTIYIALRWYWAGRAPLSNQYESLVFLLWAFIALYLFFLYFSRHEFEQLTPWVAALALVGTAGASLLDRSIAPLVPALQSNWLLLHVASVMAGYAGLALSFVVGLAYLHNGAPGSENRREALDHMMYRGCLAGFWLLSLGIITGAVWANSAWGSYWSWDPKETWSLITWLYYAMAVHLRRTRGWTGARFAWTMTAGFVLVMFTYFGVNYLLPGLHSYK